ncbi:hypothetical protein AGR1A_Lc40075 [Agrobacterium fabacearum CFBP 5771]|nr:hypothetical protein AGR1A_Lc40075 [Agrobacterium fabacearum CFBP 5771]
MKSCEYDLPVAYLELLPQVVSSNARAVDFERFILQRE